MNKVSSKNWRFGEIFSCAKLHFVLAESGCDMRVEALDQKEANNENTRSLHVGKICFKISPCSGNRHDPPEGRKLMESLGFKAGRHLLMDRAYEDDKARALVLKQGLIPVVPPKNGSGRNRDNSKKEAETKALLLHN